MSVIQAIILGLIQGLTEFIPVSSSGHLVLAHKLLGVTEQGLAFDVALHFGTLLALLIYFWKDLWAYFSALFKKNEKTHQAYLLIAATIPAAAIGLLLESKAESQFRSARLVGVTMLLFGCLMLVAEWYYRRESRHAKLEQANAKQALGMGFAQAAAIVPGVSRSGSTITAGLFLGMDRVAATRFSFLLGVPITAGAVLKIFTESSALSQVRAEMNIFFIGALVAFISGVWAIKFMISYLSKHGLHIFAYYRIALGLLTLLIFTFY